MAHTRGRDWADRRRVVAAALASPARMTLILRHQANESPGGVDFRRTVRTSGRVSFYILSDEMMNEPVARLLRLNNRLSTAVSHKRDRAGLLWCCCLLGKWLGYALRLFRSLGSSQ